MPRLRLDRPLWLARPSSASRVRFPALRRDVTVDVAIVGGGITGAAVAWRFADAGVRVALVEGQRVGRGSTAASTALLMQEPDEDFSVLDRLYGRARARRIWQLSRQATRDFTGTLRRLDIPCDLRARDSVYYALTSADTERLHNEHRLRRAAGVGGRWLDASAVRHVAGFDGAAAIRTRGNAQVDPFKAAIGLMQAAKDRGALVFEQSPVLRIDASPRHATVVTAHGSVRADRVVVATGYATPCFKPLAARFRMFNTYVDATQPLTRRERRAIGLQAVMLWDTERPYHYARWTADPAWNAPTNGETAVALARRMLGVVERITHDVTNGDVLVVSHKASIRALLCTLLGVDVGRFRYRFGCPVGSVSIVEFTARGPLAHTIGDRSHLNERLRNLPGT